jgi:hypothetical protein
VLVLLPLLDVMLPCPLYLLLLLLLLVLFFVGVDAPLVPRSACALPLRAHAA